MDTETCPGCKLELPAFDGPTHPYIGSSPSCWALYGEVLNKEFTDYRYSRFHATTVDAYAVQHPGVPERRAIRSVALHLMRLHLFLEREESQEKATELMARVARSQVEFEWLTPPEPNGTVTVKDVAKAGDPKEHEELGRRWANDVWEAWSPHRPIILRWLDDGLST